MHKAAPTPRIRGANPYGHLYGSARWKKIRADQLRQHPLCAYCQRDHDRVTIATVCDHITPHKGNEARFWSGPFQSLCKSCHDTVKASEEGRARKRVKIALDGWPERE